MKKTILWVLLDSVFLVVFNTVFFVLGGTDHPASVWLSYGFIHFAYIMILITPFLVRKSNSAAVFGFSIYSISAVYFYVEFIFGLIFIFIGSKSIKVAIVAQIIIFGIYAILLLSTLIANEHTADAVEEKEAEVEYIKTAASRVKALIGKTSDKKADKAIEKAYDVLHASPTKSSLAVRSIETQIMEKIFCLEESVSQGKNEDVINEAGEIIELMEGRNRELRLS